MCAKFQPPIQSKLNLERPRLNATTESQRLTRPQSALCRSSLCTIVSDHLSCSPFLKRLSSYNSQLPDYHDIDEVLESLDSDFFRGISSLGFGLAALWTEIHRRNILSQANKQEKENKMLKMIV
jgi:hypothetical protein